MRAPDFWWRSNTTARIAAIALAPLGMLYGASVAFKHLVVAPRHTRAAVICVGNLTVGGAGKTPIAIAIARLLQHEGVPVACLARGYRRKQSAAMIVDLWHHDARAVGDEPLLLARIAPTVVARDRVSGMRLARAQGARAIVMDDGHQNFSLAKDLSFVVVDGATAFGNRQIVPAGPLREWVGQGLSRADAVIIVGEGNPSLNNFQGPVLRARLVADRPVRGLRVFAFAAIGRPEKFFDMLRALGAEVVGSEAFNDHHVFNARELKGLRSRAQRLDAQLITTEKDFVRLRREQRSGIEMLPVRAAFEDQAALERLLQPVVAKARACP